MMRLITCRSGLVQFGLWRIDPVGPIRDQAFRVRQPDQGWLSLDPVWNGSRLVRVESGKRSSLPNTTIGPGKDCRERLGDDQLHRLVVCLDGPRSSTEGGFWLASVIHDGLRSEGETNQDDRLPSPSRLPDEHEHKPLAGQTRHRLWRGKKKCL